MYSAVSGGWWLVRPSSVRKTAFGTIAACHPRISVQVSQMLHFEPSLDALSLRSDVINSIKILSLFRENSTTEPGSFSLRAADPGRAAGIRGCRQRCPLALSLSIWALSRAKVDEFEQQQQHVNLKTVNRIRQSWYACQRVLKNCSEGFQSCRKTSATQSLIWAIESFF